MKYKLYVGTVDTEADFRRLKRNWVPRIHHDLDDALADAMRTNEGGLQIAWEIEGEDGSSICRARIERTIRERRRELMERPRLQE